MPTDTKPAPGPSAPQAVHVAIYEHPHGMDVRVYADRDHALSWRTAIAKAWWNNAYCDAAPPDDEIGEEYFDRMLDHGEEFFTIENCILKTRGEVSDDPGSLDPDIEGGGTP
ncbi:hypothetical protein ACFOMH_17715 [Paracoccus mangrovi]|uniref:Uncharacterized protein n=1 Tax=Paracoccus mangrovi TaxID=1715645 RepID=A0ABV7R725_9RHOB|nr:hypothetical protein [Erythrobacter sp.]